MPRLIDSAYIDLKASFINVIGPKELVLESQMLCKEENGIGPKPNEGPVGEENMKGGSSGGE